MVHGKGKQQNKIWRCMYLLLKRPLRWFPRVSWQNHLPLVIVSTIFQPETRVRRMLSIPGWAFEQSSSGKVYGPESFTSSAACRRSEGAKGWFLCRHNWKKFSSIIDWVKWCLQIGEDVVIEVGINVLLCRVNSMFTEAAWDVTYSCDFMQLPL